MPLRRVTPVLLISLFTIGCNCSERGRPENLGSQDGGGAVTVALAIVGNGQIEIGGAVVCTPASQPCSIRVTSRTTTATARASSDSEFVSWSCGGLLSTSASVALDFPVDQHCTATFTVTPHDLTVILSPPAGGWVSGTIDGAGSEVITCGGVGTDCRESQISSDQTITLVARAASGYRFDRWSGCASNTGSGPTLVVPMSDTKTCTANFVKQWSVAVTSLTGPGAVDIDRSSTGPGVDRRCLSGGCRQPVDGDESVTVTAAPSNATAVVEDFTCSAGTRVGDTFTIVNPATDVSCTASFRKQNAIAIAVTVAGAGGSVSSSPGPISGCTSTGGVCAGSFTAGASVVLTATPGPEVQVAWSTSAGGTCDGVASSGPGEVRHLTFASLSGAKDCTATFSPVRVTVHGKAGANGAVSPGTSVVTSGGSGVLLTASPSSSFRIESWSGSFSVGTGIASGCGGSGSTVTVLISGASSGAVYDCTATFQQQATLSVRVVPAPVAAQSYGRVSSPCVVGGGEATCSMVVDVGTEVTLTATEAVNARGQDLGRFVRWTCSNGASSTSRSSTATITANTTCVAQFYGLWSRYWNRDGKSDDGIPNLAWLAPGVASGLPTSSSSVLIDGTDNGGAGLALAGLIAADDDSGGVPRFTDWARPRTGAVATRISTLGDDGPSVVGVDYPSAGRYRGIFGSYEVTRSRAGTVASLARAPLVELFYPDPGPVGATTYTYDTQLLTGRAGPARTHALGGFRTLSATYSTGQTTLTAFQNASWVVLTDNAGAPLASGLFLFPGAVRGTSCATPYMSIINDVAWDSDPKNPGGVIAVGQYSEVGSCYLGAACPPEPATQHTYGFIAKLDKSLRLLGMRALAPESAGRLTALSIVENLARTGYMVFGQYADAFVAAVELSFDLGTISTQLALAAFDPNARLGRAPTSFDDALVDRVANRYIVLAHAAYTGATSDVVVMSLDAQGAPMTKDGWRFGTPTLDESGSRIIQPAEGGFAFSGQGATVARGVLHFWVTRADDRFEVPLNGTAPAIQRTTPLGYAPAVSLGLIGTVFTCSDGWVDLTAPTSMTVDTAPAPFTPVVNVQAP